MTAAQPLAADAAKFSEHFTWGEVIGSSTADRLGIDNTPPDHLLPVLQQTAQRMDRVRRLLGQQVIVTSWYRSLDLNRAIGSRDTSAHVRGQAVDFRCPGYGSVRQVFDFLRPLMIDLEVDQLIIEFPSSPRPWIHIGWSDSPRFQSLVIDQDGTRFA